MKKNIFFLLMILVLTCLPAFATEPVSIRINGVDMTAQGILRDDRTFVPIRFVAEGLGAEVRWSQEENAVYIFEQPDEIIPESEWFNEDFDKMMQAVFEHEGLDFEKVRSKTPIEYAYKDENVGALTYTGMGMNGNLFIELYGEGTMKSPEITISSLWYFNIETHEYGKICERYSPSKFYEDERFSSLLICEDFDGNAYLFDTETFEKWVIPDVKILGVVEHTVYYMKDKLYVKNLKYGEEKAYETELSAESIYYSYTDGKRIFIRQRSTDDGVFVLDLNSLEVTKCVYSDTEFDFWGKSIFGIQKTADHTKPPRIFVNDMPVYDIPDAFVLNDRTYVPLRFIAEEMGAEVRWIDGENRVEVTDKPRGNPWYAFAKDGSDDILKFN